MEKEKSGKQILDDFFNEIGKLSNIDREIAQLFSTLYKVESPIDTSDHNGIAFLEG